MAHLNAEKNELLGIVAHDLKNPLGQCAGTPELLQEEAVELPPEEVRASPPRSTKPRG